MGKTVRIAVIGSNMIDLITNIDRMPRRGETVFAPSFDLGFGGKGANQAVAAAMLGAEVVMVTKVGDDMFGREVKKNFESFGIDTTCVDSVPDVSNGVAPIFVEKTGHNSILIVSGANGYLKEEDVERARSLVASCDLILLQLEIPLVSVYRAVEMGVELGIPVILNPAPAADLDFDIVKKVSVFVPNETELQTITGMDVHTPGDAEEAARSLIARGMKTVVVTLGERGSLLVSGSGVSHIEAINVDARDTTGAGDAFIGSFACFLLETGDLEQAARRASRYAALSTLKTGTQKSFLRRDEFERAAEKPS